MRACLVILCHATLSGACSFQPDDHDRLVSQIIAARAAIEARHETEGQFTYRPSASGPYVMVLTPPNALTREAVAAMELPLEARQALEPRPGVQQLAGALFVLVRPQRSEWHQLGNAATLPQLLYVWKRAGEDATVTLNVRDGRTEIAALR